MVRPRCLVTLSLAAALLALVLLPAPARGDRSAASGAVSAPGKSVAPKEGVGRASILRLARNPMMLPLAICSVVAVGFALERLVALRRGRVIPRDFVERFVDRLANGKLDRERAAELCRANESPASRIFARIVGYWGEPAVAIRQAIGHDAAAEIADLKRNVRVLNGTATLAPLLGLLGTVVGMIESFEALSGATVAGADKGAALAHGISLALGTTAAGLLIAVVSVTAYYVLLNRVDVLVRDLDAEARRVVDLISAEGQVPRASVGRPGFAPHEPRAATTLGRSEPV